MGSFRFRDRIKLLPGVHLNIGKKGVSLSAGAPGATVNVGASGLRSTVGVPGTGVSYSHLHTTKKSKRPPLLARADSDDAAKSALDSVANLFPDSPEKLCCYLWLNEVQCGPYSWFQIIVMLADETINWETRYWVEGMEAWGELSAVEISDIVSTIRRVMRMS